MLMPAINGIASERFAKILVEKSVEKYQNDMHFDTGIIMTPIVLDVLSKAGRDDLAYKLLTEKTAPSFYDMMQGETTLIEFWIKHHDCKGTISHCHPMFGAVLAWVYKNLAGMDLSRICDKQITVQPKLIKEVKSSKISKITSYGKAAVEYYCDEQFNMEILVPFGLTANVILPDFINGISVNGKAKENAFTLSGGSYRITAKII